MFKLPNRPLAVLTTVALIPALSFAAGPVDLQCQALARPDLAYVVERVGSGSGSGRPETAFKLLPKFARGSAGLNSPTASARVAVQLNVPDIRRFLPADFNARFDLVELQVFAESVWFDETHPTGNLFLGADSLIAYSKRYVLQNDAQPVPIRETFQIPRRYPVSRDSGAQWSVLIRASATMSRDGKPLRANGGPAGGIYGVCKLPVAGYPLGHVPPVVMPTK